MCGHFIYSNPTSIYFGNEAQNNPVISIKNFCQKVLLVYGTGSIKRNSKSDVQMASEGIDAFVSWIKAIGAYGSDYRFTDIYMLTSAAENEPTTSQRAISGLTGWIDCFDRAHLVGTIFAGGVTGQGEINGHPVLQKAYEMGHKI